MMENLTFLLIRFIGIDPCLFLIRGIKEVHIRLLGGIEMDPDIGMTKCCDGECCCRVEANCYGPKQKEGVDVHSGGNRRLVSPGAAWH